MEKNNHSIEKLNDLIYLYLVAIDKKNKNEIKKICNENKKYVEEYDIVLEIYNKKQLNLERFQFIINNCKNYLNISSCLVKE